MSLSFRYYNSKNLVIVLLGIYVTIYFLKEKVSNFSCDIKFIESLINHIKNTSPTTVSLLILYVIDRFGWKLPIINPYLVNVPNLNGRYKGILTSTYKNNEGDSVQKDIIIEIKQSASQISIYSFYSDPDDKTNKPTSQSHNLSEAIQKQSNGLYNIYFIYINHPEILLTELNIHQGACILTYHPDNKMLKGFYFNMKQNKGTIEVIYERKERFGRFKI